MKAFHLTVSSVYEAKFDGEALSVRLPGVEGEFEVLADHEPFISALKKGTVTITTTSGEEKIAIEKGILETAHNRAVVLI